MAVLVTIGMIMVTPEKIYGIENVLIWLVYDKIQWTGLLLVFNKRETLKNI